MIGENSMRKILLAGAAMLATTGMAMAVVVAPTNTDSVSISTNVAESCTVSITATTVTLPANATASAPTPFTFTCNYTGSTASLSYTSTNGGVKDGAGPTYVYSITPALGLPGSSAGTLTTPALNSTALTPMANSFVLQLQSEIQIAGNYSDTLTVTVSP
jgi:hypothetical protein